MGKKGFTIDDIQPSSLLRVHLDSFLCEPVALADPFPWSEAEVSTHFLKFAGDDEATYRVGHVWQGERVDISIVLDLGAPGPNDADQELMREMTDEPPKLSMRCDTLVAEWSTFPLGADAPTVEKRRWRLDDHSKIQRNTEYG